MNLYQNQTKITTDRIFFFCNDMKRVVVLEINEHAKILAKKTICLEGSLT